jgi:hypothetical protein
VSYDVQQAATKQFSYAEADKAVTTAFTTWATAACATSDAGTGSPSITFDDLGPVACSEVQYNQTAANEHVVIFRDDAWPYDDTSNTLALTTLSYDKLSGEIYDADVEVNTHDYTLSVAATLPPGGYDFLSIITHEAGHFLGLAHATDTHSTMYAHYTPGTDLLRQLTADDVAGACAIYSPDGLRHVATAAAASGTVAEFACDPTPRHGFSSQCAGPESSSGSSSGCSASGATGQGHRDMSGASGGSTLAALAALACLATRRRRQGDRAQRKPV